MAQDTNAFMVSQAANIISRLERQDYEALHYARLAPVLSEGEPLATSVEHYKIDATGDAKMTHYAADDLPRVDAMFHRYTVQTRTFGSEYAIDDQSAVVARMAGRDLSAETGIETRRILEEQIEDVFWSGNADLQWDGFHQNAAVSNTALTAGFDTALSTEDGVRGLISDINKAQGAIFEDSKGRYLPDTLVMPHSWYIRLQGIQLPNTTLSMVDWIARSTMFSGATGGQQLNIMSANRLSAGNNNGYGDNAGQERMVVYSRSPSVLRFHLPMPVTAKTPYWKNPRVLVTELWANVGGLEILRPYAMRYLTNK